ncbi:hypothetical protein Tco_0694077 [Tanacetum coccineum]
METSTEALIVEYAIASTPLLPPPSPLSPWLSPLLQIPSPPLPLPSPPLLLPSTAHKTNIPKAEMPPRKRVRFTAPTHRFEVMKSLAAIAARQTGHVLTSGVDYGFIDTVDASIRATKGRVMTIIEKRGDTFASWLLFMSERLFMPDRHIVILRVGARLWRPRSEHCRGILKMAPKKTTTPMIDAAIKGLIAQGIADALAEYEATRNNRNGDDSHQSGSGRRRIERTAHECTYSDFLKCQPLNFKGAECNTLKSEYAAEC